MKRHQSRRQFIKRTGLYTGAAVTLPILQAFAAETNATNPNFSPPDIGAPGQFKIKWHGRFSELPVGSVIPRGWIKGWLQRQADGLSGHPENMAYPYDTCMYAGKIPPPPIAHGQTWWPYEQSGYFLDGAVRLSRLIAAPGVKKISANCLDYILNHSGPGKLGESVWGWPNTVVGRALMAEYGATGDPRIANVLNQSLQRNSAGAGRDGYIFEEAFYLYGLSGDPHLLKIATQVYDRYFASDPNSFSAADKIYGAKPLREHGVTAAEQLKLLPLLYCYTGDEQALALANLAYLKVERDSLMPDGGIVSSERLGTTVFDSLHETCDITDWSWSFGYLLMAGGDAHWADLIERTTFNALPGAVTKDFKQVQYFSSANQILASNTVCPRNAPTRMSYRAAHDTECCAGNVNRAMPNYVTRMWMRMGGGLAATLFGPCEVRAAIDGQIVTIVEETDYPFRETILFKVKIPKPALFELGLRIPEWCDTAAVTVNGAVAGVECEAGKFTIIKREFRDGDTLELRLPMELRLVDWFGGSAVSVQRGPLVYSVQIAEKRVESTRDPEAIRRVLKGNNVQGFPAVEFYPTGEWRYGLDAAQKAAPEKFKVIESRMPENPFIAEAAPVRIEVPLRALPQWAPEWKPVPETPPENIRLMPKNPGALPTVLELQSPGEVAVMTLVPYGCTHLRLTTLPLITAGKAPDKSP